MAITHYAVTLWPEGEGHVVKKCAAALGMRVDMTS